MWSNVEGNTSAGGFMDESYATTSAQPKGDRDTNRSSNIIPLMIGHLKKCTRESKTIWNTNIRFVCIVGIVRKITVATTKVTYELEDETGTITAFKWLEADAPPPDDIVENQYARIHGSLREQDKKTHVFVLKIVPVKTYAQVFSHLLEVVHMAMKMNKNSVQPVDDGMANNDDDNDETCHSLTTEQKIIYRMIKSTNNKETGIERSELKSQVPPNLLSKVDAILDFLASEGHIYTTCTDDHFLAT
ncbi:hypothetical protein PV327_005581 [Microctonus hyperodae]|uniref:Replication protein A C-terminal domain-containing protein n=1 Tax=Microctonus hyperodae TaxID=165561 RepID=A0AA39G2G9_MICHY|nr:hypothetical protein PV327_005581 [Microctonus hyperodae]